MSPFGAEGGAGLASSVFPALALALLLLVAGCSTPAADGGDGRTGQSVTVSLSNQHDEPYAVRIALASGDLAGDRVTYENGTNRRFDVQNVSALPPAIRANATVLEPLGEDLSAKRFVLEPSTGLVTTFEDVPEGARLVYVVSRTGENASLRNVGVSRCAAEGARLDFSLEVGPTGSTVASTTCSTERTTTLD